MNLRHALVMETHLTIAFSLTLLAGLSTGIGSAIAFFTHRSSTAFLSVTLGFSAGVMIYVSFMDLLMPAQHSLIDFYGRSTGGWLLIAAFFSGVLVILMIDYIVPAHHNPHQARLSEDMEQQIDTVVLQRTGLLTAFAIAIHNFPEGMATFFSSLDNPVVGFSIAIAIALHNIPEGISISVPIYYATGSRSRAFWYSFFSGLAEPLGALIGYLLLRPFITPGVMGIILAAVAGIMVFISLDQLIPNAKKYDVGHRAVYGLIAGMAVMAITLMMLSQ